MVWRMDARPIIKMQAPRSLQPRLLSSTCFGVGAFSYLAGSHQAAHRGCRWLASHGSSISIPLARYFRVNLLEFFSAFNAHSRRHLRQARSPQACSQPQGAMRRAFRYHRSFGICAGYKAHSVDGRRQKSSRCNRDWWRPRWNGRLDSSRRGRPEGFMHRGGVQSTAIR